MTRLWMDRSARERWMLGVMFALLAIVILWFAIIMPIDRGQRAARAALLEATDRNAAIRATVRQLKALPASSRKDQLSAPLDQFVGQSAGEAGLTLERAQMQGTDRIDIAIASVRSAALFSWLTMMEAQDIRVETINARPSPTAGSVSVQAVLVRSGAQ